MDRPRQSDHLGVNKNGRNIRKSPIHQPNFAANANPSASARPQAPQPQIYSVSKNDFRSVVQQLTGSPSRDSLPRPPPQNNNLTRPQNTRLQRVRPAPLTEINRPSLPHPSMSHSFVQPPQQQQQPMVGHGDQSWSNTAVSPISEFMRYLQSSPGAAGPSGNHVQPGHEYRPYMPAQHQPQPYMPAQPQPPSYVPAQSQPPPQTQPHMMSGTQQHSQYQPPLGLIPSPVPPNHPFPQFNGPVPGTPTPPSPRYSQMYGGFPSPQFNGGFPSPRYNGFGSLPSPTSQFFQPSPTGYPNMFSPRSPYPLLSPGVQYPQPLTPNFSFSQVAQSGSGGPGAGPGPSQPPPSPGLMFPPSPSGFFPILSPRWGGF
ncbi:unnamed protein product [Eruca vesicaria subsp. sativa]|uniref:VQ domain-containing protein n=1 Tax=Eruca vesicaria subsp. sativa TaxID=29727 RepID=A0ABC8J243_ERUVS|nr:unnamed protein product [Eruca vesicaria subsp. sativa]